MGGAFPWAYDTVPPMGPDIAAITDLLKEAAAAEVLPRFRALEESDIQEKTSSADLVTVADLACEEFLTRRLLDMYPGSKVIGEEAVAKDDSLMEELRTEGQVWIIDPIDGTWNFAHGDERFAIILACVQEGRCVAGWILDPIRNVAYTAERGQGAFRDGQRLSVAAPAPIGEMTAVLYVGRKRTPELYEKIQSVKGQIGRRVFTRCAAAEYMALVDQEAHYAIFTRLLPWDHVAGCLIHAEAGGYLAYLDGSAYAPYPVDKSLLLAPDPESWGEIRDFYAIA